MLGDRIKLLRKQKNMTMKELGRILTLGESTISMYEKGKRTPDYNTIKKIAEYFNTTTDFILEKSDNQKLLKEKSRPADTERDKMINEVVKKLELIDDINILKDLSDYSDYLTYKQNQNKV